MAGERKIYIALGRAGCGKTRHLCRAVRWRVQQLHGESIRPLVIIHDTRMGAPGKWIDSAIGCLAPEESRFETVGQFVQAADDEGCVPSVVAVYRDVALHVMALAWARCEAQQPTLVVLDELDQLPPQLRRERPDHLPAYNVAHYGRPHPCDVYATVRQPQRIDSSWFALATNVALFNLSGDLQLARIRASGWPDADDLTKSLPTLPEYQYIQLELPG